MQLTIDEISQQNITKNKAIIVTVANNNAKLSIRSSQNIKLIEKFINIDINNNIKMFSANFLEYLTIRLLNNNNPNIITLLGLGNISELKHERFRKLGSTCLEISNQLNIKNISIIFDFKHSQKIQNYIQMFSEGIFLRNYSFNKYQSNKTKNQSLSINILLEKINSETLNEINKAKLISNNINIARDLVNETAEFLTPKKIAKFTKNISKTLPLIIDVLKNKELKQHNLNLILAVDRGSNKHSSARLIKIKYRSKHATNKQHICLIGKGVTFDSGGLNIKTTQNMYTMKSDMAGIATALGTILNIAQLKSNINVTAYLVCVENSIGPSSYHPGDIITSKSGLNVEISNTDAEGRLILADALTFAENEEQPDILIDIATLTGACVIALGNNTAGIFSNNKSLISDICKISKSTGESFWHMPLSNSLNDQLKSDIADIKNCGEPWGGAISASLFLQKFVKNKNNWCHIDIAGPAYSNKKYYYKPKGGTGFGIRTLTDFILHISNLN